MSELEDEIMKHSEVREEIVSSLTHEERMNLQGLRSRATTLRDIEEHCIRNGIPRVDKSPLPPKEKEAE